MFRVKIASGAMLVIFAQPKNSLHFQAPFGSRQAAVYARYFAVWFVRTVAAINLSKIIKDCFDGVALGRTDNLHRDRHTHDQPGLLHAARLWLARVPRSKIARMLPT